MKYRYLSIIFLILVLSIGAVCAQDDATDVGDVVAASSDDVISVDNNANELSSGNSISIDDNNYNDYFSENGTILENANISDGDTIVLGNINDKVFDIDMPLTITSNGTTINNVVFVLNEGSDDSIIENLNINCDDAQNTLFTINAANITINNNVIGFVGSQNASDIFAIYAELADNLNIQANTISYVGKTNGTATNRAVYVLQSENVTVEGNTLDISIPSGDIDWTMGVALTSGITFLGCDGLEFIQNTIDLITEASVGSYPTVYVIDIKESGDVVVDSNIVTAKSYVNSSYLYSLLIQGNNFEVSDNEFDVFSDTNHACGIDIEDESSGIVDGNFIMLSSPYVAYGIYACDWNMLGQFVNYTNNNIEATSYAIYGMELLYGEESVVDCNNILLQGNYTLGIAEMMMGTATVTNNDIYVYGTNNDMVNVGDMVPALTVGIFSMGESQIHNNAIESTGNWTVYNSASDVEITDNYLVSSELLGDDSVYDTLDEAVVENNIPIADATNYNLTNDTFFLFFTDSGYLRNNITAESLTFIDEFSNLTLWNYIDRPIKLIGDEAILHDMSFIIRSDNVTVEDFTFKSDRLSEIITIYHSDNVSILSSEFYIDGLADENNTVINLIDSNNATIYNNFINFTVETNSTYKNAAILAEGSDGLIIDTNDIIAYLPSRSIDWGTGTVYSEGVCLDNCNNAVFDDNTIHVISNDQISDYDTLYALHITGDNATIINFNRIGVIEAPYGYALVIAGKDFYINDNNFGAGENGTYACGIDVESNSNGIIDGNRIMVIGVSAYGIYTADWAGDVKADITNNIINASGNTVFGMSLSGTESLVDNNNITANGNFTTGIASKVANIIINDNEILANGSNVGTPAGYDSMGIETTGVHIVDGNATVTNNIITANNKYAVDFEGEGQVTDNEIYAEMLTGDFAVDYIQDDAILVVNNTPEMELDYKLTNDTFYIYFDEEGLIREQIEADNLTFIGEFSNLVGEIYITKPIVLLSDNATLNNIALSIESDDVTVDGFNFEGAMTGITVLKADNVQILNNNLTVDGLNDSSNVCIKVLSSDNVLIENNTIIFGVKTNDTCLNAAVAAENSDNLTMVGNIITASLPARSINWTSGEVYSQGVFLNGCDNAVLENNTIGIKSNDQISTYDTLYAVNIKGDNATLTGNAIGVVEAPYGYALVVSGEDFNISKNMFMAGENGTYACAIEVDGVSTGIIDSNLIYAAANESAYGIYTANWAGDVKANITNNLIFADANSPFALSLSGSEALVENNTISSEGNYTTGIASAVDRITINNNTISTNGSNVGTPLGYDSMGIETTGVHIVNGHATVTNNNVTTTGEFTVDLQGTGQVTDNYLIADVYTGDASVAYVPDQSTAVMNNTPAMLRAVISADNVIMYYKNGTRYVITLTDQEGNPLVNKTVILTINNASYTRHTNENGTASLAINLNSGNYTASAFFAGDDILTNASIENNITVLTTILADDLVKMFRNATQYYATFLYGQGNLLVGAMVTFNINGVMYNRMTNENGTAKLNINLEPGTYILTAINPANGEMHSNNITVLPTIESSDLVKYYKNESQYIVTLYGADGKVVGAGETVTFNINGVFYTRTTNELGQAKLNINLEAGNYTITAEYKGCRVSNNIEVKSVLTAKDLVKKYGVSDQFIAYVVDGQGNPYGGQTVNFNIHGVFYERVTDSDGRAILNIRLGAASDVYIITSEYNGCRITNTITIVP